MSTNHALFNKYLRYIVGAGLMLRLIMVLMLRNVPVDYHSDSHGYVRLGRQVARGLWLTGPSGYSDFSRPPGYPMFLGGVAKAQNLLGIEHLPIRSVAGVFQAVLAAVSIWVLAQLIARRVPIYGPALALLTALMMAVLPDSVLWSATLMTEAISLPLLIIGCGFLLWNKQVRLRWLFIAGIIFGFLVLVRSANIPVAAVALLLAAQGGSWKTRFQRGALYALGVCLVLIPWLGYTHQQTGILMIDITDGQNACLASSEYANTSWNPQCNPPAGVDIYEYRDLQKKQALEWMIDNPGRWMVLRAQNTAQLIPNDSDAVTSLQTSDVNASSAPVPLLVLSFTGDLFWCFLIVVGMIGFWRTRPPGSRHIPFFRQLGWIAVASSVAQVLSFSAGRFHIGALPFVYMAGSYWLLTTRRPLGRSVQQKAVQCGQLQT